VGREKVTSRILEAFGFLFEHDTADFKPDKERRGRV